MFMGQALQAGVEGYRTGSKDAMDRASKEQQLATMKAQDPLRTKALEYQVGLGKEQMEQAQRTNEAVTRLENDNILQNVKIQANKLAENPQDERIANDYVQTLNRSGVVSQGSQYQVMQNTPANVEVAKRYFTKMGMNTTPEDKTDPNTGIPMKDAEGNTIRITKEQKEGYLHEAATYAVNNNMLVNLLGADGASEAFDITGLYSSLGLGKGMSQGERKMEEIIAGLRGKMSDPTATGVGTRKPTTFEEYDRYHNELMGLKAKSPDTLSVPDKARIKMLHGILDKRSHFAQQVKEREDMSAYEASMVYVTDEWKLGELGRKNKSQSKSLRLENHFKQTTNYTSGLKKREQDINNKSAMMKSLGGAIGDLKQIVADKDFESGVYSTPMQKIKTWLASEDITRDFFDLDVEQIQKQLGVESVLGRALAERLKFYSGTAVADAEFKRTETFLMGLKTLSPEDRVASVESFFGAEISNYKDELKELGHQGLTYTADKLYKSTFGDEKIDPTRMTAARAGQPTEDYTVDETNADGATADGSPFKWDTPDTTFTGLDDPNAVGQTYTTNKGQFMVMDGGTQLPFRPNLKSTDIAAVVPLFGSKFGVKLKDGTYVTTEGDPRAR